MVELLNMFGWFELYVDMVQSYGTRYIFTSKHARALQRDEKNNFCSINIDKTQILL